jgi:mRNA-degrading endonuclease RelE of RelBE toxin-antitoxin system
MTPLLRKDRSIDDPGSKAAISIDLTPEFQKNLSSLAKKYKSIKSDIQPILSDLGRGLHAGDRISGVGEDYFIFKVRIRNTDIQKGKRGGYRLIYQVESESSVLLLAIYSKSTQEDITAREIRAVLSEINSSE